MNPSKLENRLQLVLNVAPRTRGITILGLLAPIAALTALTLGASSLHFGKGGHDARSDDDRTVALHHAKYLNTATLMYAADYDGDFFYAQDSATAKNVIQPYLRSKEVSDSPTPGGQFLFNMNVGGVNISSIESPAETVGWYEVLPNKTDPFAVGYVDGHAKLVQPDGKAKFQSALKKRFPRKDSMHPLPAHAGGVNPPRD